MITQYYILGIYHIILYGTNAMLLIVTRTIGQARLLQQMRFFEFRQKINQSNIYSAPSKYLIRGADSPCKEQREDVENNTK